MTDSPVYVNPLKFSWTLSVNGLLSPPDRLGRLALLIFMALLAPWLSLKLMPGPR